MATSLHQYLHLVVLPGRVRGVFATARRERLKPIQVEGVSAPTLRLREPQEGR